VYKAEEVFKNYFLKMNQKIEQKWGNALKN